MVEIEESAQAVAPLHLGGRGLRRWCLLQKPVVESFAMPSKNRIGRDERRHLSQDAASKSLPEHREPPSLGIVQLQPPSSQLGFQRAILLAKKRDHIALLALEPSEQSGEEHL